MSSQTETNTNNRTSSDISDKKVDTSSICPRGTRKESSKKIPQEAKSREKEVESGEQTGNSVSTQNSLFNSPSELPNMSQTNKPTLSSANSEKKIRKSKVSKPAIDATDGSLSQITKPVAPSNWDEATQDEKDTYKEQLNLWKQFNAKQKKAKQQQEQEQQEPQPIQLEDDDEEEQPVQQEEVPVDASIEDELEQGQKQDDEEQANLMGTDQFTASTLEVSAPFPNNSVEPLSALDGVVRDDALKPMSSPPSQDAPLSAMDYEEETSKPSADEPRAVQFQEEEGETCMFCQEVLGDRKVSKCSFCSGHLCLGACREKIINEGGNNCPQCRKKYFRTEEEIELDEFEAAEAERQRQAELRRAELIRKQTISRQMSQADQIRRETLADYNQRCETKEARRRQDEQEMRERHQRERAEELLEGQRLTCMTDAEIVAHKIASIPVATLNADRRAEVRSTTPSRARATTPSRARATTPTRARARAPSPTPSNEGSRRTRAPAVQKDRSCAGCDIRVGDELELKLRNEVHTWRIRCLSAVGKGVFRIVSSSNRPEVVGQVFEGGLSPINKVFQEYAFSVGTAKQMLTPWAGYMSKYRNGVFLEKQR